MVADAEACRRVIDRTYGVVAILALVGCGRIGFSPSTSGSDSGGTGGVDAAPVPCSTDSDCGACQRCGSTGFCASEPINQVFVGHRSTCFLGADGSRWCAGQYVGLPGDASPLYPQRIPGEDGWTSLSLGWALSYGVRNGALDTFGIGATPTEVGTDIAWAQIDVQLNDECFRRSTGVLTCDAATVAGVWADISTGYQYQCGVQTDGSLWCWGMDYSNALGLGVEPDGTVVANPARVGLDNDWMEVHTGASLSCARKTDGTIWCWGAPQFTGTNEVDPMGVPTEISSDTDWTWLDVRWTHACAGKPGGGAMCWGSDGNLDVIPGVGDASVPTDIGYTFDQFLMGGHHNCGENGGAWTCWGWNMYSQLGTGDTTNRPTPGSSLCGR